MSELFAQALLAGLALALLLAPLGCFVLWRRMAYFGDAIAHAALLGVALALLSNGALPVMLGVLGVASIMALLLPRLSRNRKLSPDTVLGVLAYGALSLALVLLSAQAHLRVDVNAYLFGDILAMSGEEILWLWVAAAASASLLLRWRQGLVLSAIDPALAAVEGVNTPRLATYFTLLLAAVIALCIKLAGALLLGALLIIPAAAARLWARSPAQMVALACAISVVAVLGGVRVSFLADAPSGPSMVLAAVLVFAASALIAPRDAR